jgi:hypothetical protein
MAMLILILTFHIHDVSRVPVIFFMKVLSNELSVFMMRIVNGRFAHHIMNTHRRRHKHLHDVDSKAKCQRIFCYPYSE